VSEGLTTTPAKTPKARPRKGGKKGVPKKAEVVVLAELRKYKMRPLQGQEPTMHALHQRRAPLGCMCRVLRRKVSCWTGGAGGRKKRKSVEESTDSGKSTEDDAGG